MKQFLLLIIGLFISGIPSKVHAQCATPTCITPDMIAVADHVAVKYDPSLTHYEFLFFERAGAIDPSFTNARVFRQVAPGKEGFPINYRDAFCTLEGFTFGQTDINNPQTPIMECLP